MKRYIASINALRACVIFIFYFFNRMAVADLA